MNTTTELANYALAYLGQAKISNIDDTGNKAARTAKEFMQPTIDEELRLHRWNCATKRATLSQLAAAPNHGYPYAYALPTDLLRLLELNGEPVDDADTSFEIEAGRHLLTHGTTAEIRYVARIPVAEFDPLLAKVVALALATTLAVPLTTKIELQTQCAQLRARALADARRVDAFEVGNGERNAMRRMIDRSPLIRTRHLGRHHRDPLRFETPY